MIWELNELDKEDDIHGMGLKGFYIIRLDSNGKPKERGFLKYPDFFTSYTLVQSLVALDNGTVAVLTHDTSYIFILELKERGLLDGIF